MIRLEDFGITPSNVTVAVIACVIAFITAVAVSGLMFCLFGIGLYRKAVAAGEKKPYYAFLPLLRLYTLGKMAPGSEKTKKVFACLLPSLALAAWLSSIACAAVMVKAASAVIFAAEDMAATLELASILKFPIAYSIIAVIISVVLIAAAQIVAAYCLYGAFEGTKSMRTLFAVLSFLFEVLGPILLYANTKYKKEDAPVIAQGPAQE